MWHAIQLMVLLALAASLSPDARGQVPVPYRFEAANYWGNDYQTIAECDRSAGLCKALRRRRALPGRELFWTARTQALGQHVRAAIRGRAAPHRAARHPVLGQKGDGGRARPAPGAALPLRGGELLGQRLQTIPNATDPQDCARRCDADARCRVASFLDRAHPSPGPTPARCDPRSGRATRSNRTSCLGSSRDACGGAGRC